MKIAVSYYLCFDIVVYNNNKMTGIRKKTTIGFLSLALTLLFSGMISLFELNKLSKDTRGLLENSSYNMSLSKRMLDAVQEQNTYLLQAVVLQKEDFDKAYYQAREDFESALGEATKTVRDRLELENIYTASKQYYELAGYYLDETVNTDIEWFVEMYKTSYIELTTAIKSYMVSSQHSLVAKAVELKSNAYRAITPGIITLFVAILMVLMLAFFIDLYYTKPTVKIAKGLRGYLNNSLPFKVNMEGHDEVFELKEDLETLITQHKSRK